MSYRAAVYGLERIGVASGPARVKCDAEGCDAVVYIGKARNGGNVLPPAWFFKGKSPPGWRSHGENDTRRDYCPEHRDAIAAERSQGDAPGSGGR